MFVLQQPLFAAGWEIDGEDKENIDTHVLSLCVQTCAWNDIMKRDV